MKSKQKHLFLRVFHMKYKIEIESFPLIVYFKQVSVENPDETKLFIQNKLF